MYIETITRVSTLSNKGQAAQQNLDNKLTGQIRKPDSCPYYMDSDIPELDMSVKSSRFTLASARCMTADTFEGQLDEYANRVHSNKFAYVGQNDIAYIMTLDEFLDFVRTFCTWARESKKNGGGYKIRCRAESKKMLAWLEARI